MCRRQGVQFPRGGVSDNESRDRKSLSVAIDVHTRSIIRVARSARRRLPWS